MLPVFAHFSKISIFAWGKKRKLLVFTAVYVCVKAKLTLVSFFSIFFLHLSLIVSAHLLTQLQYLSVVIILNFRIRFYQKFQLAIFAFMVAVQCFESGKIFINYLNFCHVCLDFSLTSVFEHLRTFKVMKVMIACDWD